MNIIADRIFFNAKIYSVNLDDSITRGEALAVRDGKIIYIGSNDGVKKYKGSYTTLTDCNYKTVLPGFCDAHMHFMFSAIKFCSIDLSDIVPKENDTPDDIIKIIQDRIKKYLDTNPNCKVIRCSGFDRSWFMGGIKGIIRPITRLDIDKIVNDRPVILFSFCMHNALVNSYVLDKIGITKDTKDTISGKYRRFSDGSPDGYLKETYVILDVMDKLPNLSFNEEELHSAMLKTQNMMLKNGYTLISDCLFLKSGYDVAYNMAINDEFKLRLNGVYTVYNEKLYEDFINAILSRKKYRYKDIFKVDTIKYFLDGDLSMIDGYTKEYCIKNNLPINYREPLLWNKKDLIESMIGFQKNKFNIHVHAMGDYGTKVAVECMNKAYKICHDKNLRNVLAHCSYIKDIDKYKMASGNIIASIQPKWQSELCISAPLLTFMLGCDRKKTSYPNKSLVDKNILCAYGSDYPVDVPNFFEGIQTALTRKVVKTNPMYEEYKKYDADMPDEVVSFKESVKAHTINGAYQHHLEDITGSIEVGKSCDIVILDRNLENTSVEDICLCKVNETIFKGETVYKK